jgi:hypothetical protein
LAAALNEKVTVTENGRRRQITEREAVIAQLVNKSGAAELRATKMLIDMLRDIDKESRAARCRKIPIQRCRHRRSRDRTCPYRSRRGRPDQWSFDAAVPDHAIIEKYLLDRVPQGDLGTSKDCQVP